MIEKLEELLDDISKLDDETQELTNRLTDIYYEKNELMEKLEELLEGLG